jgi:hypothetical protein
MKHRLALDAQLSHLVRHAMGAVCGRVVATCGRCREGRGWRGSLTDALPAVTSSSTSPNNLSRSATAAPSSASAAVSSRFIAPVIGTSSVRAACRPVAAHIGAHRYVDQQRRQQRPTVMSVLSMRRRQASGPTLWIRGEELFDLHCGLGEDTLALRPSASRRTQHLFEPWLFGASPWWRRGRIRRRRAQKRCTSARSAPLGFTRERHHACTGRQFRRRPPMWRTQQHRALHRNRPADAISSLGLTNDDDTSSDR